MSDKELFKKCVMLGRQVIKSRRKFIGLLPEVYKRELYAKKGFDTIHEFAAKLAGVSYDQVNKIIQLEKKNKDKPILHAALTEGNISVNKLMRIAPIVTRENESELVKKAEILSSRALEVFVREMKVSGINGSAAEGRNEKFNTFVKPLFELPTVHVQSVKLDVDVEEKLVEMQEKGIDVNELLRQFFEERSRKIEQKKQEIADKQTQESKDRAVIGIPTKRYVPAEIKNIIKQEFGTKCSATACKNFAKNLHHEKEFAINRSHDPHFLKPLCKEHHELAHADNEKIQKFRLAIWAG